MKQNKDNRTLKTGILLRDINVVTGTVQVAISVIEVIRKLGFRAILLCGKRVNKEQVSRNFGVNLQLDTEVLLPIWIYRRGWPRVQTYYEFALPVLVKPICGIIINPYTNDLLPWVDVTYINAPRSLHQKQKSHDHKFWDLYYKPYHIIERALGLRVSDKLVLCNSYFTADVTKKQIGVNPLVIYPPVNLNKVTYSKLSKIKKNIVLTVANFLPAKKLEQIPLIANKVNAKFFILGRVNNISSYRMVLKLIKSCDVEDRVTVIANPPHVVKTELLQKAKVFLHTSLFEPFGISIVEGMGAGCIPVVHDSGGPREFVPYCWRYKDVEDAAQKIKEALDLWSPSIANDMRSIAYKFRKERFQEEFSTALKSYLEMRKNEQS
ncbi:MAG: glycosyltransferase [Candidatus Bathyarchaeales archaeon]